MHVKIVVTSFFTCISPFGIHVGHAKPQSYTNHTAKPVPKLKQGPDFLMPLKPVLTNRPVY